MLVKTFLLAVFPFLQLLAVDPEKKFFLQGNIDKEVEGIIYLKYFKAGILVFDSAVIKSGKFSFTGRLAQPNRASVFYRASSVSPRTDIYSDFYLEAKNMTLEVNFYDPLRTKLAGSALDANYRVLKNSFDPVFRNISRLKDGAGASSALDSVKIYETEAETNLRKFLGEYPTSIASAHAAGYLILLKDLAPLPALTLIESLDPKVKQADYAKKMIEGLKARIASAVGHQAPGFKRTDINGKEFSLSDLKGKYVLLTYWASWCLPCRELTPDLKNYSKSYQDKGLEIVFISCDSKYDLWKKAVEQDKIDSYRQILSFTSSDMEFLKTRNNEFDASFKGELRKMYNLMPIPSEILIDPNGTIIGRYRGLDSEPGERLGEKLKEIFGN